MSHYRFHSSRPDHWVSPRAYSDPSLRAMAYGRVRPMHEASGFSGWLERWFG